MANVDNPRGLTPTRYLSGAPYNGAVNRYQIPATDSTDTFIGDAVKVTGSADSDGVPGVIQAAAGDLITGVIVGFDPDRDDLSKQYREADTKRYVLVADSPDIVFEIQEDSDTATLAATDVMSVADIVVAAGDTSTGRSAMELDSDTAATGSSAQLRILRLVPREDNEIGANAKWEVLINEHQFTSANGV